MRMPDLSSTKKVFDPQFDTTQRRTASLLARSGEAKPVGDRVSTWMGGCSEGMSILKNYC